MRRWRVWRGTGMLVLLVPAVTTLLVSGAGPASAATLSVCPRGCPYTQIAPAVAAAKDGDTIKVGPGTYRGGITIDISIHLAGAGAGSTVIRGGGHVLTIGAFGAATEPTVSVTGVTITGGIARSSPESVPFAGRAGVFALGGGVEIPPNADFSGGATVRISNSVITGNRVASSTAIDSGLPCPPDITIRCINGDLPFAQAAGGGIDNWGTLTLANTTISRNVVGAASRLSSVQSDANGGAIVNRLAALRVSNTTISGNQASAAAPNGRFADGGGILMEGGTLTMSNSSVTNNRASLSATMPNDVPDGTDAQSGGIHVGGDDGCASPSSGCVTATIRHTTISGNSVHATNRVGDAVDFSGGINDDGSLNLRNSSISTNHVTATVPAGSPGGASADSGGIGTGGQESITGARITGNTVSATAPVGVASASSGGGSSGDLDLVSTIRDSLISGNRVTANTRTGSVVLQGAGFGNGGLLEVRNTHVSDNTGTASGPAGTARGGGIWNGTFGDGSGPHGNLTLADSSVTHNMLTASAGISIRGGGLYTAFPVTLTNSRISSNTPDNCFGTSC